MPRALAHIGREKTIATLARNLFDLERASAEDRRRVETALIDANPDLSDRQNYVAGRAIIVPSITGLRRTDRVEVPDADLTGVLTDAMARLEQGAQSVKRNVADARARLKEGEAQLSDREFLRTAKAALPESGALIEATGKGLEEASAALDQRQADLLGAFEGAQASLTDIARILRKRTPAAED